MIVAEVEMATRMVDHRFASFKRLVNSVESEDVAQDEDGELARRQELKRGNEGQRDGFRLLIPGLRSERPIDRTLEEGVGKGLEPYDFAEPRRLGRFNPRYIPVLGGSPTGRAANVQAPVSGNAAVISRR